MQSEHRANPPLRVGILIDSPIQPAWVRKILSDIKASTSAELSLVVRNASDAEATAPQGNRLQRYWANRQQLLYRLYCRMDNATCEMDAFQQVDISDLVADCPVIEVAPIRKRYSDYFPDDVVDRILEHDLDVTLRFGFRILRGRALKLARYGVWSHHHGDNLVNRGGPAGFWEVMQQEPISGTILQVLTEDLDNGKAICRTWSPTMDKFSVKRNKNNFYWKSTRMVPKKLKELHELGPAALDTDPYGHDFHPYSHRLYKAPENAEMLPLLGRMSKDYVMSQVEHRLSFDQWILAYRFKSGRNDINGSPHKYTYLTPPKDKFWADPFPVKLGDKYFILFEEYIYKTNKAHISVVELGRDGTVSEPVIVLDKDYHLSYPFVFTWRGERYMIPESCANGRVEIYKAKNGGVHEWELQGVLLDNIHAADATLYELDGRWWMFLSSTMKGLYNWDELHIYHADSPMGPWKPHRQNPVKIDVRNSRPAGHLFYSNGLFRPAQDCSMRYGYATTINRITRLTPDEFQEETVSRILPKWKKGVIATHTFNRADDLTVIDCQIKRSRFARA
jgi:hypothetical protein